jgi:hypothetical protein
MDESAPPRPADSSDEESSEDEEDERFTKEGKVLAQIYTHI